MLIHKSISSSSKIRLKIAHCRTIFPCHSIKWQKLSSWAITSKMEVLPPSTRHLAPSTVKTTRASTVLIKLVKHWTNSCHHAAKHHLPRYRTICVHWLYHLVVLSRSIPLSVMLYVCWCFRKPIVKPTKILRCHSVHWMTWKYFFWSMKNLFRI